MICEDGPWTVICLSCSTHEPGNTAELHLGTDCPTIPEAEEAVARHVEEADALRGV